MQQRLTHENVKCFTLWSLKTILIKCKKYKKKCKGFAIIFLTTHIKNDLVGSTLSSKKWIRSGSQR